jgi:hypothetical protein
MTAQFWTHFRGGMGKPPEPPVESGATGVAQLAVNTSDDAAVGDHIVVAIASSTTTAFSGATGWTVLQEGGSSHRSAVLHRTLTGDPEDTLVVSGGVGNWLARSWRFPAVQFTGDVAAAAANGVSATPNCPSLDSTWGEDASVNTWLAVCSNTANAASAINDASFSDLRTAGGGGALGLSSAQRRTTLGLVDPGSFSVVGGNSRVYTVAIRGV